MKNFLTKQLKNWRYYAAAAITFILGMFLGPEAMEFVAPFIEQIYPATEVVQDSIAPIIDTVQITLDTVSLDSLK